jgi:SNF2 family DNA or RNA helicase
MAGTPRGGVREFKVKCVYSPSLADLCQDNFAACAVDEGVKMKGEDTIVGLGVRQIAPAYRLVLTATPIKNRLPDVFRLAWWATGAREEAHARFPHADRSASRDEFAGEFLISERNLTREEMSETNRRFVRLTPQVCNVHRLWKLLGPIVLRRRKMDFGEDIVAKNRHVVRLPMGCEQAAVYRFHLKAEYRDKNGMPAVGAKLQALRIAAANPASRLLERPFGDSKTPGEPRSRSSYIPKLVSALKLIQQILERGEQVVVFSAFHDSLDALSSRLNEAGVRHAVCDGRMSPKKRGLVAEQFKLGPPKAGGKSPSQYPVMLAGVECMSEGHSFHLCNNVILMCYSWAWDRFEQAINRVHRLNSIWDVNVYAIICDGSIDRKLEAQLQEKGDATELVLDGHLLGEHQSEVNLAELLHIARKEFSGELQTISEDSLEQDWPKLRLLLGRAMHSWYDSGLIQMPLPKLVHQPRKILPQQEIGDTIIPAREASPAAFKSFADLPLWKQAFRPVR